MWCRGNRNAPAPTPAAPNSPTTGSARFTRVLKTSVTGRISVTLRSTSATTTAGAKSATPTSKPTRCANTARRWGVSPRPRKSTTSSRSKTAVLMTRRTCKRCVNRATHPRPPMKTTGGGNNPGSTPTENARKPVWRAEVCDSQRYPPARCSPFSGQRRGIVRGVGASDLYEGPAPQRAGSTAHKVTDSNRVLTRKPSTTGLTAWKEARFHG